ncbi:nitrate/nitrite transporter NrtS [Pseudoalteromonas denitrificans]|jgi:hypothetical protein|uniref:Phosphoenolpyruvate protein kinase n=1 Tax=Pseudoalteromonas denitrificans DSM 6059 TaxID=1123010 RepID=A0A1I1QJY5_9GAMM|nr:nitrate/nitrite transporter NrtS [Pseudoalteromonas denitrificans]SFD18420.1 hypothetical protein SAMN02745724_03785 [Pseudoalteromonas denitrificans DSM 6059]
MRWFNLATSNAVTMRSLRVSMVVGTILVAINQADIIIYGELSFSHYIKILLTYCVPYCVSTYASVDSMMNSDTTD